MAFQVGIFSDLKNPITEVLFFGMIWQILLLKVIFLLKKGHWKIGSLSEMQEGVKSNFRFSSASSTVFAFQESLETFWSNLPSPAQLEKNFKASAWKKISLEESRFFKFSKNMNDQNYSLYRVSQQQQVLTGWWDTFWHFWSKTCLKILFFLR